MPATGDKLPLTEWVFTRFTALSRWAAGDLRTPPDGGEPRGCRTCAACGAAYRSDLATHCAHCRAERPLAWGEWRLAGITMVE